MGPPPPPPPNLYSEISGGWSINNVNKVVFLWSSLSGLSARLEGVSHREATDTKMTIKSQFLERHKKTLTCSFSLQDSSTMFHLPLLTKTSTLITSNKKKKSQVEVTRRHVGPEDDSPAHWAEICHERDSWIVVLGFVKPPSLYALRAAIPRPTCEFRDGCPQGIVTNYSL
jgi:hypothetical protein